MPEFYKLQYPSKELLIGGEKDNRDSLLNRFKSYGWSFE